LRGNFSAEENYFSQGHKHLAPGNRSCVKRRVAIHPFSKELRGNFTWLNFNLEVRRPFYIEIAFGKKPSLGYQHLAPGNSSCGKKGLLFIPFQRS
jgi:hypothetical protein